MWKRFYATFERRPPASLKVGDIIRKDTVPVHPKQRGSLEDQRVNRDAGKYYKLEKLNYSQSMDYGGTSYNFDYFDATDTQSGHREKFNIGDFNFTPIKVDIDGNVHYRVRDGYDVLIKD